MICNGQNMAADEKYGSGSSTFVKFLHQSIHSRPSLNRIILKRIAIHLSTALKTDIKKAEDVSFSEKKILDIIRKMLVVQNSPVYCRINDAGGVDWVFSKK